MKKRLDLISITDHNAIQHSLLACEIGRYEKNIKILPGAELTSREEVHLLAYFGDISALVKLGKIIDELLPDLENKPEFFGHQVLYDNANEIIDLDYRLRQSAIDLSLDDLVEEIHKLGGIATPAHIDKNRFSLISQLGFIDKNAAFDALEVSKYKWNKEKYQLGDTLFGFPVICGSDSHTPDDIGLFYMEAYSDEFVDFDFLKIFLQERKNENHC
ncbi:MAG: hypothetical protein APR54_08530 [Candidatus Cloacimonas sp. SDB]|nr:MAG: hypothetical protein APR54_08530 [Candidatus Cloacimonas sp. SDB]